MTYEFSPSAENEFVEAFKYYENRQIGLGDKFTNEIYKTIERILRYPHAWTRLDPVFYRCLTRRFPYGVIYSIEAGVVRITALMNLYRKPDYWRM